MKTIAHQGGKYPSDGDFTPKETTEDLEFLKALPDTGTNKPVVDRTFPMTEAGGKTGSVVIAIP